MEILFIASPSFPSHLDPPPPLPLRTIFPWIWRMIEIKFFLFNLARTSDDWLTGLSTWDGNERRKVDWKKSLEWIFKVVCFAIAMSPRHGSIAIKRQLVRSKIQRLNGDSFCLFVCVYGLVCLCFTLVCFRSRRIRFHPPRIPNAEFVNIRFRNDS